MKNLNPILVKERTAAQLLDLKPAEFRSLVQDGVLPKPITIGSFERWDTERLRTIVRGEAMTGQEVIEW